MEKIIYLVVSLLHYLKDAVNGALAGVSGAGGGASGGGPPRRHGPHQPDEDGRGARTLVDQDDVVPVRVVAVVDPARVAPAVRAAESGFVVSAPALVVGAAAGAAVAVEVAADGARLPGGEAAAAAAAPVMDGLQGRESIPAAVIVAAVIARNTRTAADSIFCNR